MNVFKIVLFAIFISNFFCGDITVSCMREQEDTADWVLCNRDQTQNMLEALSKLNKDVVMNVDRLTGKEYPTRSLAQHFLARHAWYDDEEATPRSSTSRSWYAKGKDRRSVAGPEDAEFFPTLMRISAKNSEEAKEAAADAVMKLVKLSTDQTVGVYIKPSKQSNRPKWMYRIFFSQPIEDKSVVVYAYDTGKKEYGKTCLIGVQVGIGLDKEEQYHVETVVPIAESVASYLCRQQKEKEAKQQRKEDEAKKAREQQSHKDKKCAREQKKAREEQDSRNQEIDKENALIAELRGAVGEVFKGDKTLEMLQSFSKEINIEYYPV